MPYRMALSSPNERHPDVNVRPLISNEQRDLTGLLLGHGAYGKEKTSPLVEHVGVLLR